MPVLPPVVHTLRGRCVDCRRCIAACPVKFSNALAKNGVAVLPDRCIGCGNCVPACGHEARMGVDDFQDFLNDLASGVDMVAVVSPAVAANFPKTYLNLNAWLRRLGVAAVFDASFGAELLVRSLVERMSVSGGACVIAPTCPVVVSYCQIYRPELLPYVAPVQSPALHTAVMIRRYWGRYGRHRIAVFSPCVALKRELTETGLADYNVTFASIARYLSENGITLGEFPDQDYANPPADLGAGVCSPGGLTRAVRRMVPEIGKISRVMTGRDAVLRYLDELPFAIASGRAPLLVECLSCEKGCNGGSGAPARDIPADELEWVVADRIASRRERGGAGKGRRFLLRKDAESYDDVDREVGEYWEPGLYARGHLDLSECGSVPVVGAAEARRILGCLGKPASGGMYDCTACGFDSCLKMVVAIAMGSASPGNCLRARESESRDG